MIHEILPHTFDNQYYHKTEISDDDYVLYYSDNKILLKENEEDFELPRKKDLTNVSDHFTYLFELDHTPCFLTWNDPRNDDNHFVFKEIYSLRTSDQKEIAWISSIGFHLMTWYDSNRYCGKCGSKTEEKTDERAIICPNCGHVVYPKISPAVIVMIKCDDKILLAHNSRFPAQWYSLVAGYADIGESLEETVIREVKEEVGLDVKNIRYYKSQPWPFSGSMMIGFIAEADCNQPVIPDNKEITEAAWFQRGHLPAYPPKISIAGEMIEKFDKNEL